MGEIVGLKSAGAGLPKLTIVDMPGGIAACTDGKDIWADARLNDIEMKCSVVHELIHVERGEGSKQHEHVELQVRYETARRLLPIASFAGVCSKSKSLTVAARDVEVTQRVLMDRAATLRDADAETVGCPSCRKCPVMEARYDDRTPPIATQWQEQVQWATGSRNS